jgi:hypothetical protein
VDLASWVKVQILSFGELTNQKYHGGENILFRIKHDMMKKNTRTMKTTSSGFPRTLFFFQEILGFQFLNHV